MSRVLLVDAYPRSLNVLGVSLRQSGFDVTTAGDGLEALAEVESASPQLVVTATRLPNLDGYELVRRIRELPETADVPVIFVASRDSAEDRSRARELGVADYLERPVFVRELVARAHLLLALHARDHLVESPKLGCERLGGSTRHLALVDLVQHFETSRESGVVHLRSSAKEAHLYFRDGRVVDAELGLLRGEQAVYQALAWYDASFEVELKPITNEDVVCCSTQTIVQEGMYHVDEGLRPAIPVDTANSRSSSAPWSREIDPSADHTYGDTAVAGVPRAGRTARRFVAITVAVPAVLVVAGGLGARHIHSWRLQALEAQAQSAPVVSTAAGATEGTFPPASVGAAGADMEAPTSGVPVAVLATLDEPGERAPLEPAASASAVAAEAKEIAIDTQVAAANQSQLVREAERALLKGDTELALSLAHKAVVEDSADADAWLTLAAAEKASGDVAGAADAYRNCIEVARTVGVNHCRVLGKKQ